MKDNREYSRDKAGPCDTQAGDHGKEMQVILNGWQRELSENKEKIAVASGPASSALRLTMRSMTQGITSTDWARPCFGMWGWSTLWGIQSSSADP